MQIHVNTPDGKCGSWKIETFKVSIEDAYITAARAVMNKARDLFVPAGEYKRLRCGREIVMSNTPMEIRSNIEFIEKATGNVLINGLGIGMVLQEILKKPEVTKVTVIEKAKEVIQLTAPTFEHDSRVTIINADALTYEPPAKEYFDVVWHDIWTYISASNLPDMRKLERKYKSRCNWQASWMRDKCEEMSRYDRENQK